MDEENATPKTINLGKRRIQRKENDPEVLKSSTIHHLPFQICKSGNANVKRYFSVEETKQVCSSLVGSNQKEENSSQDHHAKLLVSTFRGRRLLGAEYSLPDNFHGFIVQPSLKKIKTDKEKTEIEKHWHCTKTFDKITYWNVDRIPSDTDEARKWQKWLKISQAVHS